jgi:transcription-repair coupling factor (superfamily II helicase)
LAKPTSRLANGGLFASIAAIPSISALAKQVGKESVLSLRRVPPGAQPFLAALLASLFPARPIVVVADGLKSQESFHQDLQTWLRSPEPKPPVIPPGSPPVVAHGPGTAHPVLFFPAWEILPHESKLPHADVISERLETLIALNTPRSSDDPAPVVVTNVVALQQRTFAPQVISQRSRTVKRGDRLDLLDFIEWLEAQGYEPEAQVNHKGELALRGGILDLFPLTSPWPVRLEFFGDDLESLRQFDPVTQISRESIESITLPPAGELGVLKREWREHAEAKGSEASKPRPELSSLCEHLPAGALFLFCEPESLAEHAALYRDQLPGDDPFLFPWDQLEAELDRRSVCRVELRDQAESELESGAGAEVGPEFQSLEAFRPITNSLPEAPVAEAQRKEFFNQLHRWLRQGYQVHVFCNNAGERQRFEEIWQDYGFDEGSPSKKPARPEIHLGSLARGFLLTEASTVVVTDAEIFGRYKVQRPRRLKSPHAAATRSALDIDFTEFEEGDYVVHVQHGIGRYQGLKRIGDGRGRQRSTSDDSTGDECLVIEYAPPDDGQPAPKLYVPVSEAHLVSKYVGTGKARPPLNTIGGTRWAKAKAQAEDAVRDLAAELLSLQAARETQTGHAFPEDNTWQREFEGSFLYEETIDQMKAIRDAKRDMELPKPMDRLICGDVGYGKTEVAIRAAFKAVMGGKQVAVLVPTTVLAQQHYNTFRERMADYPVRVELLSRFRRPKEIRHVIEQLAVGGVDIVIGTHRLVQKDIQFKELGLVVIDEEQRFGVMHKERFKLLRRLVDVLTLSATPIPRTLYLALTGARDMSTIETPPQDRLPVETVVCQYDERVVRDAIQREINRQGQVFYLHNRVFDIEAVATRLKTLVPHARILVGHGQMDPDDLEKVMTAFVNGEADVLLSTTIIESGIDIPNANTIIIDRADRFGLSDLYQLRGRVGRYKHQAYAYLLLPRHAGLLTDARKRISAIKQYSSLGSGFKIAMRDLEIRGAGNLLGPQQSGHITAVGFELYCQLLKQSVSALKGEKVRPRVEVQIRLDFLAMNPAEEREAAATETKPRAGSKKRIEISVPREVGTYYSDETVPDPDRDQALEPEPRSPAYIPMQYISDSKQRIEVYRKLAQVVDSSGLNRLNQELRDRFGPWPEAVQLLFQVQELKLLAADKDLTSIETKSGKLMLKRRGDYVLLGGMFPRLMKKTADARLKEIKKLLLTC